MDAVRITILGAGSVRHGVPVIASLATYFGERPLDLALYDADEERLDLFDALARCAFLYNKNAHRVRASVDATEMLEDAEKVILQVDANCAWKEAKAKKLAKTSDGEKAISETLSRLLQSLPNEAQVISLQSEKVVIPLDYYYKLDWPNELTPDELRSTPHQVLRWVRGEEYLHEVFKEYARSPLKSWLDDITTATAVVAES